MPLVTVCIPTYNGAAFLGECIDSAIAQSFGDLEILVVDDSSTDDTLAIARSHARRDKRIRVCHNTANLGLVGNWNRSVSLARGEWIKFLHQDDRLEAHCVDLMLSATRPGVALVATRRRLTFAADVSKDTKAFYNRYLSDHDVTRLFPSSPYVSPQRFADALLRGAHGNFLGEPTAVMLHRSAFDTYGYFNPDLVSLCDWEYWARVAVNTGFCYVDHPLADFRVHSRSESARVRASERSRLRLDPLIILYEMTYSHYYAPLRELAQSMQPPINLRDRLSDAVLAARSDASADTDSRKALAAWWRTVWRRPRLLAFSPRHTLHLLRHRVGV